MKHQLRTAALGFASLMLTLGPAWALAPEQAPGAVQAPEPERAPVQDAAQVPEPGRELVQVAAQAQVLEQGQVRERVWALPPPVPPACR